jgi:uncharacterized membrane protein YphA (DoxX/SURF4 family)
MLMNTTVWIIQGVVAALFAMTGFMKLTTPKEKLKEKMAWVNDFSPMTIKFIGTSEILGALGLILPLALNIVPVLTPIAAVALSVVMLLATRTHILLKEYKEIGFTLFLFALSVFVAIERFL